MKNLMGRIALITGSTRGIGKTIALELANRGATILLHGSKKSSVSEDTYSKILKISPKSKIYYAPVENFKQVSTMAKIIKNEFKYLDILVNNAGVIKNDMFINMSYEDWDSVIKINIYGTYFVTKLFLPLLMKKRGGRIINMSSISGLLGEYGQTNYCTSKFAIIGFTKSLAKEMGKYNITVNAVCPAIIDSDAVNNIPKKYKEQLMQKIPLGRSGKKEEVAKLVAFLGSSDADYITGQAISLNGGIY